MRSTLHCAVSSFGVELQPNSANAIISIADTRATGRRSRSIEFINFRLPAAQPSCRKSKRNYMVDPFPQAPEGELASDEQEASADPWNAEPERRATIVATALHAMRLDKAVVALAPEFSRNHLQGLIEQGCVTLDGRTA